MANSKTSGGIGLGGLLCIVLVILKATGHISMGWFWVITSFIWGPILGIFLIFGIVALISIILILLGVR